MKRGFYSVATVVFSGLAASSFLLITFNTGWILRELSDTHYAILLACTLLVPIGAMVVASVNERARRVLMMALLGLFEVCSYVVVTTMQNAGINTSYRFYTDSITWYSLMLGTALSLVMASIAELGRASRAFPAWPALACIALAMPGLVMAACLAAGFSGWVQNVLLAMMLQPAGLLAFLLGFPPGEGGGLESLLDPASLRPAHVVNPLKGGFLTLFYLVNGLNVGLLVGVNGVGLAPSFFARENVLFYASIGIGAAAGAGLAAVGRKLLLEQGSARKDRDARLLLLVALAVQLPSWFGAIMAEITTEGFHGSFLAQLVDGTVVGLIVILVIAVAIVHHPPRAFVAHAMLPAYCIGAFLVAGQMVKAISLGSEGIEATLEYLPLVLLPELVVVANVVVLAAIPHDRERILAKQLVKSKR
ncbi:MAG: hypothetical protein JW839_05370 [Candidatus Lokiarchaeota archaeon]|nr:hypothetical protein [Candidatus Lokiarchaeota archaeon]